MKKIKISIKILSKEHSYKLMFKPIIESSQLRQ